MFFLFAFILLAVANAASPNGPQECKNVTFSQHLWELFYPTVYHYQGFSRGDGFIALYDPTGAIIPAQYLPPPFNVSNPYSLSGSVYHQYFNGAGQMVADLFLGGLAPPGILVWAIRQISNPVVHSGTVCQNFLYSALAPDLLTSYSEITPSPFGDDFMSSAYYSQDPATLGQVFSNEIFKIDQAGDTSFSQTNTYSLGNTIDSNYLKQSVYFRYTPITEAQAIALGYNPANVMP